MRLYIKDLWFNIAQRRLRKFPVAILMYHSVGENSHFFTVPTKDFRKQMMYLKESGYHVVSLTEVVTKLKEGSRIEQKTVVLTFDDGYEDNFTNAFPILKEFHFPATIFVSTDFIGTERLVRGVNMKHLSEAQIKETQASGLIDIQPHGCSHRKLAGLSLEEIEHEMAASRSLLEGLLVSPKKYFAYPYGALNGSVEAVARKYFAAVVGVHRGYVSHQSNLMDLERQSIDSRTTFARFKLKI